MVRRWGAVLLLAAAWLLLQQGAWRHALSHDAHHGEAPHESHHHGQQEDHHAAHGVCSLCLGLQAAGAALPVAPTAVLPVLAGHEGHRGWTPSHHWATPWWRPRSRAPPMTVQH